MRPASSALMVLAWLPTVGAACAAERADGAPPVSSLAAFAAALDSRDSATEVLGAWCADHRMADPPVIRAVRDRRIDKPAGPQIRRLLGAARGEPIRYRRVVLMCGDHALSEADNWYRPRLLTAAMNDSLERTDTPFGAVVRPLGFHRQRLAPPAPPARPPVRPGAPGAAGPVLRRSALLVTPAGTPFSLVVETYGAEILAFHRRPG